MKFNRAPQARVRLKGMGLWRFVGNASSILMGSRQKGFLLMIPMQRYQVPSQQSLAFFLVKPPPFLQVLWQVLKVLLCDVGILERERLPGMVDPWMFFSSLFLSTRLFVVLVMWSRFLDVGKRGPPAVSRWNLQVPGWRLIGWTRSMLETDLLTVESEGGALEADLLNVAPEDGALEADLLTVESEADVLEDDQSTAVLEVRASSRPRRVGMTQRVRRAALRAGGGFRFCLTVLSL